MKRTAWILIIALLLGMLGGCKHQTEQADIAATTLPVYQFTCMLTQGTGLTVTRVITESVSCLHDYSLNTRQVKAVEAASIIVISGAGLEDFMGSLLENRPTVDASAGVELLESCHDHEGHEGHSHHHESDSHIWLSPALAMTMAKNICHGLQRQYPEHSALLQQNLQQLLHQLQDLLDYGKTQLSQLTSRELLTFHDGFSYFAHCFDLHVLAAVEEEAGAETSAHQLIELIGLVRSHQLPAIFTETNGSDASARVIAAETGTGCYTLDMAMAGQDYFAAMYRNIDIIKEALG